MIIDGPCDNCPARRTCTYLQVGRCERLMEYQQQQDNIMKTKTQTKSQKARNIFASIDGNFITIKIPDNNAPPDTPGFDVWRHDGSEFYEGVRYIKHPLEAIFVPRTTFQKRYTHPTKQVVSYTKRGAVSFDLELLNTNTNETRVVRFNTPMRSLAPSFIKRREKR